MGMIEDIILRYSARGMNILRERLPDDYCSQSARALLSLPRGNIVLTTGFCVGGHPETDGPAGVIAVAWAMRKIGYSPIIVTDELCRGIFESEGFQTIYFPLRATKYDAEKLLDQYQPTALFSLERCGINSSGDYASMRGISIREKTSPIDLLFTSGRHIISFGVGDGGNEIGMGNLADEITRKLSIDPCVVKVDHLIIATVSNWGGYGICACLEKMTGIQLLPSPEEIESLMKRMSSFGLVDGISGLYALTEDGYPETITREILSDLRIAVS